MFRTSTDLSLLSVKRRFASKHSIELNSSCVRPNFDEQGILCGSITLYAHRPPTASMASMADATNQPG